MKPARQKPIAFTLLLLLLSSPPVLQAGGDSFQDVPIAVSAISEEEILDAISEMGPDGKLRIIVDLGANGANTVQFSPSLATPAPSSVIFLGDLRQVEVIRGPNARLQNANIVFDGSIAARRFVELGGSARLATEGITFENWGTNASGGVVKALNSSGYEGLNTRFINNRSDGAGGVAQILDSGYFNVSQSVFDGNESGNYGGSLAFAESATGHLQRSAFMNGDAATFGCEIDMNSTGQGRFGAAVFIQGSQFSGPCIRAGIENPWGGIFSQGSSFYYDDDAAHSTGSFTSTHSYYGSYMNYPGLQADSGGGTSKPNNLCEDFGSGAFKSLGYNLNEDSSCGLNQPTDITNTEGMTSLDGNGIFIPQVGSPLLDSGMTETLALPGETLHSLPCDYKDITGLGRPQDGNNDGVFECDRGAAEAPGPGAIVPGHSAAFFDPARDGMGQYVEMISADTAVVYTFTARPDGTGSAWFIGVGYVQGNSIVVDQVLRLNGTSFGAGFDSAEIETSVIGGQSMVFNDCEAGGDGGNVAYSGNHDQGFEALITRAQRLSDILGCNGGITPHANAGLSGSYFLPARDGEGIVVQWLPNGQVLVIFFTYDLNGDQQWVIGIGDSDGFSVTMDALYASSNTVWGSGFDPDDVDLDPWGTFELIWTECGGVQFSYNSSVAGYGSATRQYIRLSNLWEATCPDF